METVDEKYREGFNTGCWLACGSESVQKEVLNDLIRRQNPDISYTKGIIAGKKQMEKENLLAQLTDKTKTKDRSKER